MLAPRVQMTAHVPSDTEVTRKDTPYVCATRFAEHETMPGRRRFFRQRKNPRPPCGKGRASALTNSMRPPSQSLVPKKAWQSCASRASYSEELPDLGKAALAEPGAEGSCPPETTIVRAR